MVVPRIPVDTVRSLVHDAATAPSMHNAQPWRFVHHRNTGVLDVFVDAGRGMPHADPDRRAQYIGCGAALFNLRVAAAHAGLGGEVSLLPDPADPLLAASVRLSSPPSAPVEVALDSLYPALSHRHTSRLPFDEARLPDEVRLDLRRAADAEGAHLVFPGSRQAEVLLDLVSRAEEEAEHTGDPDERHWVRIGMAPELAADDGIPWRAVGPLGRSPRAPVRDFGHGVGRERARADFEEHPQLAILSTDGDHRADWLAAGQALERVLLTATLDHLATALATQPLEHRSLRTQVSDLVQEYGPVQMLLRLGYGPAAPHPTPRRPVTDILDIEP